MPFAKRWPANATTMSIFSRRWSAATSRRATVRPAIFAGFASLLHLRRSGRKSVRRESAEVLHAPGRLRAAISTDARISRPGLSFYFFFPGF